MATMRKNCCFVIFFVVRFNLPVAGASVECRKHYSFAYQINTFILLGDGKATLFFDCIETAMVDTKSQAPAFPGHEYFRRGPFSYRELSYDCFAHLFYFFPLELSLLRIGAVWRRAYGWQICGIQQNIVLCDLRPTLLSVPHKFVFIHHRQKGGFGVLVCFVKLNRFSPAFVS